MCHIYNDSSSSKACRQNLSLFIIINHRAKHGLATKMKLHCIYYAIDHFVSFAVKHVHLVMRLWAVLSSRLLVTEPNRPTIISTLLLDDD